MNAAPSAVDRGLSDTDALLQPVAGQHRASVEMPACQSIRGYGMQGSAFAEALPRWKHCLALARTGDGPQGGVSLPASP